MHTSNSSCFQRVRRKEQKLVVLLYTYSDQHQLQNSSSSLTILFDIRTLEENKYTCTILPDRFNGFWPQ